MSIESNKRLVRSHIDLAWNEAAFERLGEVWAPDAVVHLANNEDVVGLDALKEHLGGVVLPWSDRVCRVEQLVGEGDILANRWSSRAVGPSSEGISMAGMDFYRIERGQLAEESIALGIPKRST